MGGRGGIFRGRESVRARAAVCVGVATGTAGARDLCECDGDYELIAREF